MTQRFTRFSKNHFLKGVVLGIIVAGGFVFFSTNQAEAPDQMEMQTTEKATVLAAAEPILLSIPKIKLETSFEESLGLNTDGTAEVPDSYTKVGWYKFGPTPGELGPAVILGHVDSYQGPAVFFSLGQLETGDDIFVNREDGSVAHFQVTKLERNEQSSFPTREVYGDIDHAGLRLITCSGTFERGIQRYTHNLIVYAELVE